MLTDPYDCGKTAASASGVEEVREIHVPGVDDVRGFPTLAVFAELRVLPALIFDVAPFFYRVLYLRECFEVMLAPISPIRVEHWMSHDCRFPGMLLSK